MCAIDFAKISGIALEIYLEHTHSDLETDSMDTTHLKLGVKVQFSGQTMSIYFCLNKFLVNPFLKISIEVTHERY